MGPREFRSAAHFMGNQVRNLGTILWIEITFIRQAYFRRRTLALRVRCLRANHIELVIARKSRSQAQRSFRLALCHDVALAGVIALEQGP